jgi:hypothetical protein
MSAACWCCSGDMIAGRIDLTGYRMAWRILIRMRDILCYRSLICLQSLGVVDEVQYHDGVGPFYHVP